jgi:GDP-L-fucose synthase
MLELSGKRVWVAGDRGMVGSALVRRLEREQCEILTASRAQLDLRDGGAVDRFVADRRPHVVLLAAAKVGGIHANYAYPADFILENLQIETSVIAAADRHGVETLTFLGSSCIYPRLAEQPIREEALLTGPLEPTNEWYAIAKIAGVKMCQAIMRQRGRDFISAMPTNLYGPGDNYDLQSSHVLPALIAKAHAAKREGARRLVVWGTGTPQREFMHVDDCADAIVFLTQRYSGEQHVNVGSGQEVTIAELARLVMEVVGLEAELVFDASKPDGTPRKRLDTSCLEGLGWRPSIPLREGLASVYQTFLHETASGEIKAIHP